ncbi:hypothetical protein COLSTE_01550 [Collinsella stercoris DSM 13279]|uniref:Uncharacterized protein n=1 Tax=Collinsella stercoris DSM 13279 TaxID=445975 RepID=B6GBT6_9ACTN|nr:hypothetical protein COLSTE_01550 [Collinsella stercoris DSM 13279]
MIYVQNLRPHKRLMPSRAIPDLRVFDCRLTRVRCLADHTDGLQDDGA